MTSKTLFKQKLNELWKRRICNLYHQVDMKLPDASRQLKFSVQIRDRLIKELTTLASDLLRKKIRSEFNKTIVGYRRHHIKGRGWRNRSQKLQSWINTLPSNPVVYSFWKNNTCLYVGEGLHSARLMAYIKSVYLHEADRINLYFIKSPSYLSTAECLAIHYYTPRHNKAKAPKMKWGKKCPICKVHDRIREDLRSLFKS